MGCTSAAGAPVSVVLGERQVNEKQDIVERLREKRGVLDNRWPGPTDMDLEAAAEIEYLRDQLKEADAELEKFGDVSFSQYLKDFVGLKAFAKQLSNALLRIRPLGGSEMFVKRYGDYFADPEYCGKMIEELRAEHFEAVKDRYRKAAEAQASRKQT